MLRRQPRTTRTDTPLPYPTLVRSRFQQWQISREKTAGRQPLQDGAGTQHRKHAHQDGAQADQHDDNLEQVPKAPVANESIDDPEKEDRKSTRLNSSH